MRLIDPGIQDEITWFYARDGRFSFRTTYYMVMESLLSREAAGQSDASSLESPWKRI